MSPRSVKAIWPAKPGEEFFPNVWQEAASARMGSRRIDICDYSSFIVCTKYWLLQLDYT
jgi:hypothetical protein